MATRKKDPAKKGRKTAPQPKRGTKKVAKAQAKKQVSARAKPKPKAPPRVVQVLKPRALGYSEAQAARAVAALASPPKPRRWARFRSAITGLFVSLGFAKKHPDTTVRERVDYDGLV